MSFCSWFDEINLIILWIIDFDEKPIQILDITSDLTLYVLGWSWQALGLHHRLFDQLKPILYPLKEIGVVSVGYKEIVIKCTIFHI